MPASIALSILLLQAAASATPAPPAPPQVASIAPAAAVASAPPVAAPSPPAADPAPAEKPDPVMCDYVSPTGNPMMTQKVCHKASVWARMARGD